MIKLNLRDYLKLDIILISLFCIIPMFGYLNSIFHGVNTTWPLFFLWLIVIVFKGDTRILIGVLNMRKFYLFLLFIFILIVGLNHFFVKTNHKSLQYTITFINFLFLFIIDSYYSIKPVRNRYAILYILLIGLGVQAAISIPFMITADVPISRFYSAGLLSTAESQLAVKNGVGNNGTYSSAAIIIFGYIPILKNTKGRIIKSLIVISIILILISSIISTFLLPVLLLIIGLWLSYFYKHKMSIKNLLRIFAFAGIFILLLFFLYNSVVKELPDYRRPYSKIEKVFTNDGIQNPSGRYEKVQVSIDTFKNNPLFGIGVPDWHSYNLIGEHSTWIDYLANFGLVGIMPFYLFLCIRLFNRFIIKHDFIAQKQHLFYFKISIILFVIANFGSPLITTPNLYIMLFLLFSAIQYKNKLIITKRISCN